MERSDGEAMSNDEAFDKLKKLVDALNGLTGAFALYGDSNKCQIYIMGLGSLIRGTPTYVLERWKEVATI